MGQIKNPEDLKEDEEEEEKENNPEDLTGSGDSRDAKEKSYSRDRTQGI